MLLISLVIMVVLNRAQPNTKWPVLCSLNRHAIFSISMRLLALTQLVLQN